MEFTIHSQYFMWGNILQKLYFIVHEIISDDV